MSSHTDLSKVQDDEVGDGTTSVAVLAGELLREAEHLINAKIHPMTIVDGFRRACAAAVEALEARAFDNASDPAALREDLLAIARTTLSSKILTHDKDHFASIAVDSVMCLKGRTNLEPIHIIKKAGATMRDSFLAEVRTAFNVPFCTCFHVASRSRVQHCLIFRIQMSRMAVTRRDAPGGICPCRPVWPRVSLGKLLIPTIFLIFEQDNTEKTLRRSGVRPALIWPTMGQPWPWVYDISSALSLQTGNMSQSCLQSVSVFRDSSWIRRSVWARSPVLRMPRFSSQTHPWTPTRSRCMVLV